MLTLSRRRLERIFLEFNGQTVAVTVTEIRHSQVRLGFEGSPVVRIRREELMESGEVEMALSHIRDQQIAAKE